MGVEGGKFICNRNGESGGKKLVIPQSPARKQGKYMGEGRKRRKGKQCGPEVRQFRGGDLMTSSGF